MFSLNLEMSPVSNNTYTPQNLQALTVYYWRVRGVNTCGEGVSSSWYSFQTAGTGCNTYTSTDTPVAISATFPSCNTMPPISCTS